MKQNYVKNGRLPEFKNRLNELMQGMSTTEFAQKLELSRQTVGFYLNGDRIPDARTVIQICEKCNVSADWLLGIAPKNTRTPDLDEQAICQKTGLSDLAVRNLIGTNKHGKKAFIQTIDYLLRSETMWEFFSPAGTELSPQQSLLETISDYLFSPVPKGILMLSKDGKMNNMEETDDITRGENGWYYLPSKALCLLPAKEMVDKVRVDRIVDALKKARKAIQFPDDAEKGKEDT